MRLKYSVLPVFSLIFTSSAIAGAALPSVNVGRSVSARAMYGEAPVAQKVQVIEQKTESVEKQETVARAATVSHQPLISSNDVLTPRRPSGNLWAQSKDTPLRMPSANEFAVLDSSFMLPEESLDRKPSVVSAPAQKIVLRPEAPAKKVVQKVVDEEAVQKAYEAGRIAELQRIADKALAERSTESKTRKLVVPMNDAPAARSATVRSTKSTPMSEEEFAYKDTDDTPLTKLSPMQLKRAFKKTYVSENKHLSAYKAEDRFDTFGDDSFESSIQGFDSTPDFSERNDIRPLEIKLSFHGDDAALSRDNFMLLSEYAGIVAANPKRAVQISIPEHATRSFDGRRLAARRLTIIEQVLKDNGLPDQKIVPVLADREDEALVLRVISNEVFQSLTQKRGKKSTTTKSLAW